MTEPETRREPLPRRGRSLLGVVAYLLVPGERRRRATGHFRLAGFEVLRGARALARPERMLEGVETGRRGERRERIEIE
jgi:hypothetical protein